MKKRYDLPIPAGWYQVGYSFELEKGQAKAIRYFGQDMVLFRTESGVAKVLDAYCPHMGAHLGHGIHENMGKGSEVRGEDSVCPFHGWKFNGAGYCTEVPYAQNMPPKVAGKEVIRPWPVQEVNQVIWVWYHPQRAEPSYDVKVIPEADPANAEWGEVEVRRTTIRTHIQELAENGADPAHFHYVHGVLRMPETVLAEFDGHYRRARLETTQGTPRGEIKGCVDLESIGPGQGITRFTGICETVLMGNVTPIEDELVEVNFGFLQKKVNGVVPKGGVNAALIADIMQQLEEDRPIWEYKIYQPQPALCDGDGPIAKFRKWYSQFYVDAQVTGA